MGGLLPSFYITFMHFNFNEPNRERYPEIGMRASLGFVKNIYDPIVRVREPLSDYQTMLALMRRDNDLVTASDIITDFSTYRGYDFIRGNRDQRDKLRDKFEDLNWLPVDKNLKQSCFWYGDAFLEQRDLDNKGKVDELHPLETTEMRIAFDKHGELDPQKAYVQRPFRLTGLTKDQILDKELSQGVWFSEDQVIHFRAKWVGSQVYSYNPLESATTAISTKLYASNYLMNIFINMPPSYLIHLAGAGEKQRKELKADIQQGKTNYKKNILISSSSDPSSKIQVEKIESPLDPNLQIVQKWLKREVLKVTRVPMSWVEESASENRGITESQQRPFDVKIISLQRDPFEVQINRKLLPALGFKTKGTGAESKVRFKYNTTSFKEEAEILQNAGLLRDMGLKPKSLVNYLDNRGILGLDPDDFEEEQSQKNVELNPSRQRMDKNTQDMTNKLDSQGVSKQGEQKAKEVSMRTNFGRYPYVHS